MLPVQSASICHSSRGNYPLKARIVSVRSRALGPGAVAVAARSAKRGSEPVLSAAAIYEYLRMLPEDRHYHVLPSVIIQIAKSGNARWNRS